jgi:hypothetical protein
MDAYHGHRHVHHGLQELLPFRPVEVLLCLEA